LIVDESEDARMTLAALLSALGAECRHVANASDAVAILASFEAHAILIEWMSHRGLDRGAIPTLQAATTATIMVVTTTAHPDAFADHADGYFMKPLRIETVEAICHAVSSRIVS
jgi:DNA-binding response OmpR family regulator